MKLQVKSAIHQIKRPPIYRLQYYKLSNELPELMYKDMK